MLQESLLFALRKIITQFLQFFSVSQSLINFVSKCEVLTGAIPRSEENCARITLICTASNHRTIFAILLRFTVSNANTHSTRTHTKKSLTQRSDTTQQQPVTAI